MPENPALLRIRRVQAIGYAQRRKALHSGLQAVQRTPQPVGQCVLLGFVRKIAIETSTSNVCITKEDVYREAIRRVGVFQIVRVATAAVAYTCEHWQRSGLGWIAEPMGHCTGDDYDDVCLYYGSSTYDRAEMARLLDDLIEDAEALGIETKSPEEVDRLLSLWQCEDATCAEK